MRLLHPEYLWLAPLVALPILIHLLNRIRYRRERWAAIDFLLSTERRAVRRARLRQILLMALRTLLLAAALGALVQPVFRGSLAGMLGGTTQVAVLVDASASMSASDASGQAFARAKEVGVKALASLPRATPAIGGTFSRSFHSPFREPVRDRAAVASVIESAPLTGGAGDVPRAIRDAAEALQRSGGGGTIWVLSDLQASDWRADDPGAWETVRRALEAAGRPRIAVTDLAPAVEANIAVEGVRVTPAVLVVGDAPKLIATVSLTGAAGGLVSLALFFDGKRIDTRSVEMTEPGRADVVFRLPALEEGAHVGLLELSPNGVPADDRFHFLLRTAARIPLLVVDGAPSSIPFEGAGDFLALAGMPPEVTASGRSAFAVKPVTLAELAGTDLDDYAAVFLADVPRLSAAAEERLRAFATAGGLVVLFPGPHTDASAWNASGLAGAEILTTLEAEEKKPFTVAWTAPANPITATLPREGLNLLRINRLVRLKPGPRGEVLMTADRGDPFLVRSQLGKGKVYAWAVSCQDDFSNLPLTPVLLLAIHRIVLGHLVESREPPADDVYRPIELVLPPGTHRMRTPDGRLKPLPVDPDRPGRAVFDQTGQAGVYQLVAGSGTGEGTDGTAVAALNVPASESSLERIAPEAIRGLLVGSDVVFTRADGGTDRFSGTTSAQRAASGFPLAALAIVCFVGAVLLAFSITRPARTGADGAEPNAVGT